MKLVMNILKTHINFTYKIKVFFSQIWQTIRKCRKNDEN